jgi:hypothetical protein
MVSFVNLSGKQANKLFNLWQKNQIKVDGFSCKSVEYDVIRTAIAGVMTANFLSNANVLDVRLCNDYKYKAILDQCLADAYNEALITVLHGGRPLDKDLLYCRDQVMLAIKHREVSVCDIRPLIDSMSVQGGFTEHLYITFSRYYMNRQRRDNVVMATLNQSTASDMLFKLRSLLLLINRCLDINTVFISVKGERIEALNNHSDLLKGYVGQEDCVFESKGITDSYLTRKSMTWLNKLIKLNYLWDSGDFFMGLGEVLLSTRDPDSYTLPSDTECVDTKEEAVRYPVLNAYTGDRFAYAEKLWLFLERYELKNKAAYLSDFVDIVQNGDADGVMPAIDNTVYNDLLLKCYRYLTVALRHTLATVI